jgi:ATP-dependent helicase/nuclease subunit A
MVLERDVELNLPSFRIVSASAGSGKTYTLTLRYVQLLLSPRIPNNSLKNILAITFTNNAAAEMRQRVLRMLKEVALGKKETVAAVREVVSLSEDELRARARRTVDNILDNFSDFQVRTIDSFLGQVFRASAFEFGFNPEFEVVMSNSELVDLAFELYAKQIRPGSPVADEFKRMSETIGQITKSGGGYLWDPYAKIAKKVKDLQSLVASQRAEVRVADWQKEIDAALLEAQEAAAQIQKIIDRYGATINRYLREDLEMIKSGEWAELLVRTPRDKVVNVGKTKAEKMSAEACDKEAQGPLKRLNECLGRIAGAYARNYFRPYASVLSMIAETLESVRRTRGRLFIGDINKAIVRSLNQEVVPEVYFILGDRIAHYLIDEFQDTSPIQWAALSVLAGNALSEGGSLLLVGDTKQSIYGFRGADWQIMRNLIDGKDGFPSAEAVTKPLEINRRSGEKIVLYTKELFRYFDDSDTRVAADRSGLLGFDQRALPENEGRGVVEVVQLTRNAAEPAERKKIVDIIKSARQRGYRFKDIAILTPRNADVIEISGWLNEERILASEGDTVGQPIPFVSHSSLDVRIQPVTTEMIALLQFLDSPIDDLAFATFILGGIFPQYCRRTGQPVSHQEIEQFIHRSRIGRHGPLYKAFERDFPNQWKSAFESLFAMVGYAPLYDLVVEAYKVLDLFSTCPDEGRVLVKFLEVVKEFEESGSNSIKDFLEFTGEEDEEGEWNVDSEETADAVRLMTVHKSKGLEFRIVIVLLSEAGTRGADPIVLSKEDGIELLHVSSKLKDRSAELEEIYADQRMKGLTDTLNALYVVLTRAEDELYVIALSAKKEPKVPCSLLTPSEIPAGSLPRADEKRRVKGGSPEQLIRPSVHAMRRHVGPVRDEKLGFDETRRGDALHLVLAQLDFVDGSTRACVEAAVAHVGSSGFDPGETCAIITAFLDESGIMEHFRPLPGRRVLNEQEFVSRNGDLYRADRVVVDEGAVTVIDFKSGREHDEDKYRQQIGNYMEMAAEVFGTRNVKGCIAYVDLRKITGVSLSETVGGRA